MPRVRLNLAALRGNRLPGSNGAERTPHLTRRELLGMAGTADFTCELKQGLAGWKMKLKHSLGGFSGQAPFERWLLGAAILESPVRLRNRVCSLDSAGEVGLAGRAYAEYRPDGSFAFRGNMDATAAGETIPAASADLAILSPD